MKHYEILVCDQWLEGEIEPDRVNEVLSLVDNQSEVPMNFTDGAGDIIRFRPARITVATVFDHEGTHKIGYHGE